MNSDNFIIYDITCPITYLIMLHPVLANDGFVYEQYAIKKWFENNSTSPMTNEKIKTNLFHCQSMLNIINNFLELHPEYKPNQYVEKKKYKLCKDDISKFIMDKNYDKLLNYYDYSAKYVLTPEVIENADSNIIEYIIGSSINLSNSLCVLQKLCKTKSNNVSNAIIIFLKIISTDTDI